MTKLALGAAFALLAMALSGCVYQPYPTYAAAPGYPAYYYPAPAYGSLNVGLGFGDGWHHDGWHGGWHHWH